MITLSFKEAIKYISENYKLEDYLINICGQTKKRLGDRV